MNAFTRGLETLQEASRPSTAVYSPMLGGTQNQPNLTGKQEIKLAELLKYNLKTVRAYLLKEDFHRCWGYVSPYWAGQFLDKWCAKVMLSRIEPMKKVAKSLRAHRELILNYFRAKKAFLQAPLGSVEGFNNKAKSLRETRTDFAASKRRK